MTVKRDYVVLRQALGRNSEPAETIEVFTHLSDAMNFLKSYVQQGPQPWLSINRRSGHYYDPYREYQMRVFIKRRKEGSAYVKPQPVKRRNHATHVH